MQSPEAFELPIFPLPDAVLFPGQTLPLHVFEPRYRALTEAALEGSQRIGIALLQTGYEEMYFTPHAPVHRLIGVGRLVKAVELPEGRYNILLRGECRARIDCEMPGRPFRVARVEPQITQVQFDATGVVQVRSKLETLLEDGLAHEDDCLFAEGLELVRSDVPLEICVNLLSGALPVAAECRQHLLECGTLGARAAQLVELLSDLVSRPQSGHLQIPPASLN